MNTDKTLEEIRREGLAALRKSLGIADMVRFFQQFEHGNGNYTAERQDWVQKTTQDDIRMLAKASRKGRKVRKAG